MPDDLLSDTRILVTRPAHQAQPLCDMLEAHGGQAIRFPVISIEPVALSGKMLTIVDDIAKIDFAIFISPNAVEYGISQLFARNGIPDTLKLVTIGQASAKKLTDLHARPPDIYPTEHYNSEALLALDGLQEQQVRNKKVLIFRGCGGRELLAQSLRQRGAEVIYAEVYRRVKPELQADNVKTVWGSSRRPDIITITSSEGLHNLVSLLRDTIINTSGHKPDNAADKIEGHTYLAYLWQTPLVVVTEKMRIQAQTLGFNNAIMVADRASNEALLDRVLEWAKMRTQ